MENGSKLFLVLTMAVFLFMSCSVEKRIYNQGYYLVKKEKIKQTHSPKEQSLIEKAGLETVDNYVASLKEMNISEDLYIPQDILNINIGISLIKKEQQSVVNKYFNEDNRIAKPIKVKIKPTEKTYAIYKALTIFMLALTILISIGFIFISRLNTAAGVSLWILVLALLVAIVIGSSLAIRRFRARKELLAYFILAIISLVFACVLLIPVTVFFAYFLR